MIDLLILYALGMVQPYVGAKEYNRQLKVTQFTFKQKLLIVAWPFYAMGFVVDGLVDKLFAKKEANGA